MNLHRNLNGSERHRLNMWLLSNKTEAEVVPNVALAKLASKELNFDVTASNISASLDIVEISKKKHRMNFSSSKTDRTHIVALSLFRLYEHLGEEPPKELLAVVQRKPVEKTHETV